MMREEWLSCPVRMHLLEGDHAADDGANFKFAYIVTDDVLGAFSIPGELRPGPVHNIHTLLEGQPEVMPDTRYRHALIEIVGIYTNYQQPVHKFDEVFHRIIDTS